MKKGPESRAFLFHAGAAQLDLCSPPLDDVLLLVPEVLPEPLPACMPVDPVLPVPDDALAGCELLALLVLEPARPLEP
jgi:hypothetical protein